MKSEKKEINFVEKLRNAESLDDARKAYRKIDKDKLFMIFGDEVNMVERQLFGKISIIINKKRLVPFKTGLAKLRKGPIIIDSNNYPEYNKLQLPRIFVEVKFVIPTKITRKFYSAVPNTKRIFMLPIAALFSLDEIKSMVRNKNAII